MSDISETKEARAQVLATAREWADIIVSQPDTLLLDLDSPEAVKQYERVSEKMQKHFIILKEDRWLSKSGNTHVRLTLADDLPTRERILLQAALGSDGVKEMLSLVRLKMDDDNPCVLFKPKLAVIDF